MKDKPNEWVSISDLMSGVMAVVMLLLVISVIQKTYAEMKHKQELEEGENAKRTKVTKMLTDLENSLNQQGMKDLIDFNVSEARVTLRDGAFEKSSACITPLAREALGSIENKIIEHLQTSNNYSIFVDGHTDSDPVKMPVTNYEKYCTVYDDNYTLSAARAREARKLLINKLTDKEAKRVIVAGYGDSRPLEGVLDNDRRNRRVEIQFVINRDNNENKK